MSSSWRSVGCSEGVCDKMNLHSASYIARCVKPSHSRDSSSDLVQDFHVTRNGGHYQSNKIRSPEIMSEHMTSDYSDAGDTFASRPSNAGDEDHDSVSCCPLGKPDYHKDVASRDFILKRFLPAAQAMTTADRKSSAPTSSLPPDENRSGSLPKYSSYVTTSRPGSFESGSSRNKNRFIHEVKQDVSGVSNNEDVERFRACGFPIHLGRLTLLQFRYSFWTSKLSGRNKAPQTTKKVPKEVVQDETSENSDDLFWSDEEVFNDEVSHSKAPVRSMNEWESMTSSEISRKGLAAEMQKPPARLHSMETVHTPDHRGFLGVPKASNLSSGEMERSPRQVDRLGARLTRMLSKTNYMESRNGRSHEQNECEAGEYSSQGPSATTSSSSTEVQKTKWVDAFASLRPPPSPKMPSESWLSNTLPPERFLLMKKLSRKPLGSFIPIKPIVKPTAQQSKHEEKISSHLRPPCSLKEHLQGRPILSPTMQAV